MNYSQYFLKLLQQQNGTIRFCNTDQFIGNESIVAYQIQHSVDIDMQHQFVEGVQKIYLFIASDSVVTLTSLELLNSVIVNADVEIVVVLERNATFYMKFALLYALKIKVSISIYLQEDCSTAEVKGLYAIDAMQNIVVNTYQYHVGRYSQSNVMVNGMLNGLSSAAYQGLIKIEKSAHGSKASQENKNIVLSAGTRVISVPSIEVLQRDVQCYHGSAIGNFDQNALWYLQSRGFLPEQAKEYLIRSFFHKVLEGLKGHNKIKDAICQKMI